MTNTQQAACLGGIWHAACELRYWTRRFGCSADELKAAVRRVGPMATDVERALQQTKH